MIDIEKQIMTLDIKYDQLRESVNLIDEYSRHIINQTMTQLGIMIAIATGIILIAAYFMIKQIINNQVDKEVERKVLRVLSNNPPIYYARGKARPDKNNKIFLSDEIEGIEELEPQTLMALEIKGESVTWGQLDKGINSKLIINENGIREITIENYYESNGEVAWSIVWTRKRYK